MRTRINRRCSVMTATATLSRSGRRPAMSNRSRARGRFDAPVREAEERIAAGRAAEFGEAFEAANTRQEVSKWVCLMLAARDRQLGKTPAPVSMDPVEADPEPAGLPEMTPYHKAIA